MMVLFTGSFCALFCFCILCGPVQSANLVLSHHGLNYLDDSALHLHQVPSGLVDVGTPSFEVSSGGEFYLLCMSTDVETFWATNAEAVEKEVSALRRVGAGRGR